MKTIVAIIILTAFVGCTEFIPGQEDDTEKRDSTVIKIDTVKGGHDYEFDFKL